MAVLVKLVFGRELSIPDVVKTDVERAKYDVLCGANEIVDKAIPIFSLPPKAESVETIVFRCADNINTGRLALVTRR